MTQERLFNKALFEVDDRVQARHTDERLLYGNRIVRDQKLVTNADGFQYQIIFFDAGWASAWDYEPVDPAERKAYYAEYAKHGQKAKIVGGKGKSKPKKKSGPTLNLNKIKTKT